MCDDDDDDDGVKLLCVYGSHTPAPAPATTRCCVVCMEVGA